MNNLDYVKLIATVSKPLSKETILSKLINFVTVFRVNLADKVFDDYQKKYIDTILKLDNSKTIMFETKWEEIKVKNINPFSLKENDAIIVDFSEFKEEENDAIYINYGYIPDVPVGAKIGFLDSDLILQVKSVRNDKLYCVVTSAGKIWLNQILKFIDYKPKLSFLSEKDKKNVIWGLQSGVNLLAASSVKSPEDIEDLRSFLEKNNGEWVKLFIRIHTKSSLKHLDEIISMSDGIIVTHGKIQEITEDKSLDEFAILEKCKAKGKPFVLCINGQTYKDNKKKLDRLVVPYKEKWVDSFMVTEKIVDEENPLDDILHTYDAITQPISPIDVSYRLDNYYNSDSEDQELNDYVVYSAHRITKELNIKAIICYTHDGSTAAKLASLGSEIPVIAFTKSDPVYRFINMLWGVKWYKISQTFNDSWLKRIGKEMIRIIFKGNISLDDKVLIVQTQEVDKWGEYANIVNGAEVYKFKNI